ncbi:glycosyltransferase [bacterium]|nr:glycosyltransferase [bacterium]
MTRPIAVMNLTRLGDILMTLPMLRRIRAQHPGHELHLIVTRGFEGVAELLPVDRVITVDTLQLAQVSLGQSGRSLSNSTQELQKKLAPLLTADYGAIYNITHSTISSLLTRLMKGPVIAGLTLDNQGYRRIENSWVRYFFAGNLNRGANPIHLSDLSIGIAGGDGGEERESLARIEVPRATKDSIAEMLPSPSERVPLVAIQVSASAQDKQWEAAKFAEVGRQLVRHTGARILLTGTQTEAEVCEEVAALIGQGAINLAGKSDIPGLAALLENCDLLVTNDTGTMHVANAVETRCLVITLGSALSDETGPYGRGHVILEPRIDCFPCSFQTDCPHHNCHSMIKPAQVAGIAEQMLEEGGLQVLSDDLLRGIHGWVTDFDAQGMWVKQPLTRQVPQVDGIVKEILRSLLPAHLDQRMVEPNEVAELVALRASSLFGAPDARNLHALIGAPREDLGRFLHALDEKRVVLAKMIKLAKDPVRNADQLAVLAPDVERGVEEMTRRHLSNKLLRPLLLLFRFERENIPDAELGDQLGMLSVLFDGYHKLISSLNLVLEHLPLTWTKAAQEKSVASTDMGQTKASTMIPASSNGTNGSAHGLSAKQNLLNKLRRPRMRGERLTIIVPVSGYYLQDEIIRACEALGHTVIPLPFEQRRDVIERLLLASVDADLLITVNHLGFDQDGELAELLHGIDLPVVSWYVDRPGFILLDHKLPPSEQDYIFTWEKATLSELRDYGFTHVEYLPLAADPSRFTQDGPRTGSGKVRWVANSMIYPSAEWREKAHVTEYPSALFERSLAFQLAGRIEPTEAVRSAARAEGLSIDSWSLGQLLHYASAVALTATRNLRAELAASARPLGLELYGDDGWHQLIDGVVVHAPVDYYTELASVYRGALHINATSFQMPTAVNQRLFDVPLADGILVTDSQEAVFELFDEDEVNVYEDADEAANLVEYLIKHPAPAVKRTRKAANRIQNEHTYNHRLKTIVEQVRKHHRTIVPVGEGGKR